MFQEHICKSLEYNYCHYLKLLTWPKNAVMTILSVSYRLDNEGLRHSIILDICDLSSSAKHLKHKTGKHSSTDATSITFYMTIMIS